ncbi:hypothetical protein [uncultured Fibrobacter sp.]|uniref:hypothetical protein n=1 Tax=uncultured Fibrobacter sp. TaxID=261512 RepID=UPI00261CBCB4|nr:hypothetical protein [uncultured Fibrobacter sp.]
MAESIKDEISEYYSNTSSAVDEILAKLKEANSQHDEELQSRIDDVVKNIEEKNEEFKVAVESLEKDSEFEKFTIAFFGATNAGKSTIIESLRILFDEESRAKAMEKRSNNCAALKKKYEEKCVEVINNLENLKKVYSPKSKVISVFIYVFILIIGIIGGFLLSGAI